MSTPEYPGSPETPHEPTTPLPPTHHPYGAVPPQQPPGVPPLPPVPPVAPGQPPFGQPPYAQPYAVVAPTDGMAIAALVTGIAGLVMMCGYGIGIIPSIAAIFLGRASRKKIAAAQGQLSGDGMAQAGFIMGIVGTVISALFLLGIAIFIVALVSTDCFHDPNGC